MRVVVVLGTLFPSLLPLWRACRQAGADVRLVGTTFNLYGDAWAWEPGSGGEFVTAVLDPVVATRRGHLWWWYRGLGRVLARERPDLVHVAMEPWGLPAIQAVIHERRARARVCVHGAETILDQGSPPERWVRKRVLGWTLPRIDGYVGWHASAVEAVRAAGLPPSTPTCVVPAVLPDSDAFRPPSDAEAREAREAFGLPTEPGRIVMGFIGRLVHEKGVEDLAEALAEAVRRTRGNGAFLAVWGAGPLAPSLAQRLEGRGRMLGPLRHEDVPRALAACDLIGMPSRRTRNSQEQFGRVAVEAMMCGRPVVAYATGALPGVVGDGGIVVREGDVEALARAIERLVEHPAERRLLGSRAAARARVMFDPSVAAERLVSFWERVLVR